MRYFQWILLSLWWKCRLFHKSCRGCSNNFTRACASMVWKFGNTKVINIGDLDKCVTIFFCSWWTYLWMKEGFATFFEVLGIDLVSLWFYVLIIQMPVQVDTEILSPKVCVVWMYMAQVVFYELLKTIKLLVKTPKGEVPWRTL